MRRRQHARPQLGLLQGRRRLVDHIARQHDDHDSDSGRKSAAFSRVEEGPDEKTAAAFFFSSTPTIVYVSTQGTQRMVPILSTLSEPSMDDKMLRSF